MGRPEAVSAVQEAEDCRCVDILFRTVFDRRSHNGGNSMLIPLPEGDLEDSLLVRGADVIAFLRQHNGPTVVEEAMLAYLRRHPKSHAEDFMDCLTMLFALGLIEYNHFRINMRGTA